MPEKPARSRLAIGLMSGTSMDGIDAALVRISGPAAQPRVRLLTYVKHPLPTPLRERLLHVAGGEPTTVAELSDLNFLLGLYFVLSAAEACARARLAPSRLAVIGSHGQTVYHQGSPQAASRRRPARAASTLQIGESALIASCFRVPVVADFRQADMAEEGQGAPLVPMVDYLLLRDKKQGTVALNIGGIANVTVIPPGAKPEDVMGFDTGPGNMIIDALVRHFTANRKRYDDNGQIAARGRVLEPVLARALELPFFNENPPKSAGREQFGAALVEKYFLAHKGASFEDLVRTATELTAKSIVNALERFVFSKARMHRLIVSGGGAHNRFLLERLKQLLPRLSVHLSDDFGLPVDAKEAIAFALLADRTMHGLPGNLPRVTGARRPVVLGKIVKP